MSEPTILRHLSPPLTPPDRVKTITSPIPLPKNDPMIKNDKSILKRPSIRSKASFGSKSEPNPAASRVPASLGSLPGLCTRFAWLIALILFVSAVSANAQLMNISVNPPSATVPTGQDACFTIDYNWASTSINGNNAVVTATLPSTIAGSASGDVTFTSSNHVASASYDTGTRKMTWTFINPLPAGSSGTLTMCVHFPAGTTMNGTTGSIPFVGTASNTTPKTVTTTVTAQASPQISVDKTNYFGTSPAPGGQVVYRILVNNSAAQGNYNMSNVHITDVVPPGATFVAATPNQTGMSGSNPYWDFPTVNAGETKEIFLVVSFPVGFSGSATNTVNSTAQLPDGNNMSSPPSDSVTDPVGTINRQHNFSKWMWEGAPHALHATGDDLTYHSSFEFGFTVENSGNTPLSNVVIQDQFPPEFYPSLIAVSNDSRLGLPVSVTVDVLVHTRGTPTSTGTWRTYLTFTNITSSQWITVGTISSALALGPNDLIGGVRYTYPSMHVGYLGYPAVEGVYQSPDREGNDYAGAAPTYPGLPHNLTNTGTINYTGIAGGAPIPSSYDDVIVAPMARPWASKDVSQGSSVAPGDQVQYHIVIGNKYGATMNIDNPVVRDLLPPEVTYVPGRTTMGRGVSC